jgi:chemotaxis-related protein WspB
MLLLLFKIGQGHFAMAASQVRRVIPRVALTGIADAPEYTAGQMNYRGAPVPVIDLCRLATGKPAALRISTRIILVDYALAGGRSLILGLLAEHVVETVTSKQPLLPSAAVNLDDLRDRPATLLQENEVIQMFDLRRMLPAREVDALFTHFREARDSEHPEFDQA